MNAATLHTVNKAGTPPALLHSCLRMSSSGDAILLLQDGVYLVGSPVLEQAIDSGRDVFVLQSDMEARGLVMNPQQRMRLVDYTGFVELSCQYSKTISWF
ncbi:MAG: sulfurtransferase complex subunit TusB [Pseudomonadales bacterium]|nr:sulfurtransferase complex subunit TusB [Pseudomonadales bacterium]